MKKKFTPEALFETLVRRTGHHGEFEFHEIWDALTELLAPYSLEGILKEMLRLGEMLFDTQEQRGEAMHWCHMRDQHITKLQKLAADVLLASKFSPELPFTNRRSEEWDAMAALAETIGFDRNSTELQPPKPPWPPPNRDTRHADELIDALLKSIGHWPDNDKAKAAIRDRMLPQPESPAYFVPCHTLPTGGSTDNRPALRLSHGEAFRLQLNGQDYLLVVKPERSGK